VHECLSTFFGAKGSLEVAGELVSRYGSRHVVELHLVFLLQSLLLALSLFKERIGHDCWVIH